MMIRTREWLASQALERWKAAYPNLDQKQPDVRGITERLTQLGPNPKPDDVDAAIGNSSWTDLRCDECNRYVDAVMDVGEEPDYESATASLCCDCLKNAMGWFERGVAGFVYRVYRKKD